MGSDGDALRAVKLAHTLVWVLFAACTLLIPVAAWRGHLKVALVLIAVVGLEVLVLLANGFRCPLTGVAARYTADRSDNFDIYLPVWLARHNKQVFGTIYVAGILYTLLAWHGVH